MKRKLAQEDIDRIVQMAWEDRTTFDAIQSQFEVSEGEVIQLMRNQMKRSSFKRWRKHVQGRKTKHAQLRSDDIDRFKCTRQRMISYNRISKKG